MKKIYILLKIILFNIYLITLLFYLLFIFIYNLYQNNEI